MAELDEAELVRRVAGGDRSAFDELYRRTSPWMAVRLRRRCADDVVADVLQDTYLAVWRGAGSYAGSVTGGSAVGWLWTVPRTGSSTRCASGPATSGSRPPP